MLCPLAQSLILSLILHGGEVALVRPNMRNMVPWTRLQMEN